MSSTDWREKKREEVFESTLRGLQNRRRIDPSFTLEDLRSALNHLYILDGNDWLGRGELGDIVSAATIAAYEHFQNEWEKSLADFEDEAPKTCSKGEA
ncbi:MAG: hypothetical protein LWX23_05760 [Spirochaetia bacterium]|jgi:hypothetical protein|nr:hypothetical protein [Spirochaetia bacterium]MCE1208960.1 hypothetical protein [Spirochaetia bacterium]